MCSGIRFQPTRYGIFFEFLKSQKTPVPPEQGVAGSNPAVGITVSPKHFFGIFLGFFVEEGRMPDRIH